MVRSIIYKAMVIYENTPEKSFRTLAYFCYGDHCFI